MNRGPELEPAEWGEGPGGAKISPCARLRAMERVSEGDIRR